MFRALVLGNLRVLALVGITIVSVAAGVLYWQSVYASTVTRAQLQQYGRFVALQHETILEQSEHLISVLALIPAITEHEEDRCNLVMRLIAERKTRYIGGAVADRDVRSGAVMSHFHRSHFLLQTVSTLRPRLKPRSLR